VPQSSAGAVVQPGALSSDPPTIGPFGTPFAGGGGDACTGSPPIQPPDVAADVSPAENVELLNEGLWVFDKQGNLSVPPISLANFWCPSGSANPLPGHRLQHGNREANQTAEMKKALLSEEPFSKFRWEPLGYHHAWVETGIPAGERLHPAWALLRQTSRACLTHKRITKRNHHNQFVRAAEVMVARGGCAPQAR
jgi:hypothetical protein